MNDFKIGQLYKLNVEEEHHYFFLKEPFDKAFNLNDLITVENGDIVLYTGPIVTETGDVSLQFLINKVNGYLGTDSYNLGDFEEL